MEILIINGPNLNLLGVREPELYGKMTLNEIKLKTIAKLVDRQVSTTWFQSNIEGEIVDVVQSAIKKYDGIVINPGAYSHTSIAILDALKAVKKPIVEVHISNTCHRENFRQLKLTAQASTIIMEGLGVKAYYYGILALIDDGEL